MPRFTSCASVELPTQRAARALRARVVRGLVVVAAFGPGTALVVAGDAAADSIVFARDHNIWLTDGVVERPLTTDGTASKPYRDPSQSADGSVVVAVRDAGEPQNVVSSLYELDRQGTLLRVPFPAPQYAPESDTTTCPGGLFRQYPTGVRAVVSPDASKIAVNKLANTAFLRFCGFTGLGSTSEVEVINVDGSPANGVIKPNPGGDRLSLMQPSWASNDRLLLHTTLPESVVYYDLGSVHAEPWIGPSGDYDKVLGFPVLSANTSMLATAGYGEALDAGLTYRPRLRLWTTSGAIPAPPTRRCDIVSSYGSTIAQITMAPDGGGVAWAEEDRDGSNNLTATAIYLSPIGDISSGDCGSLDRDLLIAGGSDPDWGAAPVGPAGSSPTLPVCPVGRPGTPPECGTATPATCPAGQVGTPPSCTSPAATCPAGQTGAPPNCVVPSGTPPPPAPAQPPVGGASAPATNAPTSRTMAVIVKLRRGCSRTLLRVSGRGVTVSAARRLPRSRCRLMLRIAAGATGRRDLLVKRGKRTTRLRGVIRL